MKNYQYFTLIILLCGLFLSGAAAAQSRKKKNVGKRKTEVTKPTPKPPIEIAEANYKIILEGSQSKVETPFIFVARDAETYALMRSLVEGLPASSTIDFTKNAVVAFAGMRNTGGWQVAIRQQADQAVVNLIAPPKDAMTAQIITYPFQIALVPTDENQALNLETTATWTNNIKIYRVSKGEFEYSGGIAGRGKKFNAEGTVGVLTFGDHLTYIFNLYGKGSEHGRRISETASGVKKESGLEIARLNAGTFAEMPRPPLKVTGNATDRKLTLTFESLPPTAADGFTVSGKLTAEKKK